MSSPTQRSLAYLRDEGYVAAVVHGTCELCGSAFTKPARGKPYRFCSRACGVRGRSGPSQKAAVTLRCHCGTFFEVKASHADKRKTCSRACASAVRDRSGAANPNFRNAGLRVCEACGVSYRSYNSARKYCSALCSHAFSAGWGLANQRRGYDTELKCADRLDRDGFMVMRAAASKGPFDIIAVGDGGTYFIQVKRTLDESRRRQRAEIRKMQRLPAMHERAHVMLWCWVDRKGWYYIHLNRDGTTEEWWGADPQDYQRVAGVRGFPKQLLDLDFPDEAEQ